jgi:hypothetical protein
MIGVGKSCSSAVNIATARLFLPPLSELVSSKNNFCDEIFARHLSSFVHENIYFVNQTGYPVKTCVKDDCHRPSIGKYLRYTSLMEYYRFGKELIENRSHINSLANIFYPHGWHWSKHISSCNNPQQPELNNWNCGFLRLSDRSLFEKIQTRNKSLWIELNNLSKQFFHLRNTKKDSAVQVMIYGFLLYLLSRPSRLVSEFMSKHVIVTPRDINSVKVRNSRRLLVDEDKKIKALRINEPSNSHAKNSKNRQSSSLSVSMHVRQGDSCDVILSELVTPMKSYLIQEPDKPSKRPCFSLDIYMAQLDLLKRKYGIMRVYLATDSEDMIQLTRKRGDYEWVYLNVSRSFLNKENGWIDFRGHEYHEQILFTAVADLQLMGHGDIFLGTFTSHFSKLAYYMMVGKRLRIAPFISLDYSLACDTVDICSDDEVLSHNFTIEDIITRTVECQRKRYAKRSGNEETFIELDGWMSDDNDFCAIYEPHKYYLESIKSSA